MSKPTKTTKKDHTFYNTVPQNLTRFTNLSSLDIENNMLAQHCQKHLWLYKFSSKNVSVWCQKRYCTAVFPDAQELHAWITLKANVCIFLYIFVRKFLFQTRSKVLSGGGWNSEWGWIIFLNQLAVWALQIVLQFFVLSEIFENSTIFRHFYKAYSRPLLSATMAPNLVPWVLTKNIFVKND